MKFFTQIGFILILLLCGSINSNAQKLVETFEEENIYGTTAFGEDLSGIGDINGDGYDDFLVVARFYNNGKGRAYIYFGGNAVSNNANIVIGGNDADADIFGGSGIGDINKDGYDDIILQGEDGDRNTTRLYIYYGGASFDTNVDFSFTGPLSIDDLKGDVSEAGDVNNDGYDDFVVIGKRFGESTRALAYIYHGGVSPNTEPALVVNFGGTPDAIQDVACAGDVNNDGFDDIIIGDYEWNRMNILFWRKSNGRCCRCCSGFRVW